MSNTIPIFQSHFSIGNSILTLDKPKDTIKNGPDSIIQIAIENKLSEICLLDTSFSGYLQFFANCKEFKIKPIFGLKLIMCQEIQNLTPESRLTEHKICLWIRNYKGYQKLLKLYSKAATSGFYYYPRFDEKTLDEFYDLKDIKLTLPFYSSCFARNLLTNSSCLFDYEKYKPELMVEKNDLPFDSLIENRLNEINLPKICIKMLYYKDKKDFKAFQTFRCISQGTTLDKPELDNFASDSFCWEEYKNAINS